MDQQTEIFTAYNTPPKVLLKCNDKSRTRQSEAAACDVNNIVKRFDKTGILPTDNRDLFFADVSQMGDYQAALHQVQHATHTFMQLPAAVRMKFDNDPASFLDFCSNPDNQDEMREMGLLEPIEEPAPTPDPDPTPEPPPTE